MRNLTRATSLVLAAAALAACADQPTTPARDTGPRLAAATACAASPTVVVNTEAGLRAAVAAAQPGHVIAISGTITLAEWVPVGTPGITITCAEPGAGLKLVEGSRDVLLELNAGHITVSGLVLDAEYAYGPIVAFAFGEGDFSGIRITGNDFYCGYSTCLFAVGTTGIQITDNHFTGDSTSTGIQLQALGRTADGTPIRPMDDVVISRNVMDTEDSYGATLYGAIRLRDGRNAVITHNDVRAGWANGIILTEVFDSRVDQNRVDGALRIGISVPVIASRRVTLSGVSFTGNQVTNSAGSAVRADRACYNLFEGNNIQHNAQGAVLLASTGGNVWRGNGGTVHDGGTFDCDGDGTVDPNRITGARASASAATAPAFSVSATLAPAAGSRRFPEIQ